jgi:hypothetical protein
MWFLLRPSLYKQFIREIITFIRRTEHPTLLQSRESLEWCEKFALDEENAIRKINPDWNLVDFNRKFPDLVDQGFVKIQSFDFNWGGQGNISLNYSIAHYLQATHVVETGVAYGWSSMSLLKSISEQKQGTLISVDMPFWGTKHENQIGCVVPPILKKYWSLIRLPDRDALPKILNNKRKFHMCHYDSDKTYDGKSWALPKLWDSIKSGGVLICDDVNDNLAFKDFCEERNIEPIIAKTFDSQVVKYVGIAVK